MDFPLNFLGYASRWIGRAFAFAMWISLRVLSLNKRKNLTIGILDFSAGCLFNLREGQ